MTKFFFKFKKPYFWSFLAHFPNFGGKKSFSTKSSCYAQRLAPCQNSEKPNDPIPRKHPDRCQEARMDRPYFIVSFQRPPGV